MTAPLRNIQEANLSPQQNRLPTDLRHIHLMGICGTGMASLAGLLNPVSVVPETRLSQNIVRHSVAPRSKTSGA